MLQPSQSRKLCAIRRLIQAGAVFHTVAFALDNDDFAVVQKSIQDCGGYRRVIMKNLDPVFERLIAGDYY